MSSRIGPFFYWKNNAFSFPAFLGNWRCSKDSWPWVSGWKRRCIETQIQYLLTSKKNYQEWRHPSTAKPSWRQEPKRMDVSEANVNHVDQLWRIFSKQSLILSFSVHVKLPGKQWTADSVFLEDICQFLEVIFKTGQFFTAAHMEAFNGGMWNN